MEKRFAFCLAYLLLLAFKASPAQLLVPMDGAQKNHLKAYGVAFWVLQNQQEVDWLLNYRGGSFAFAHSPSLEKELMVRGVSYAVISDAQYTSILTQIASP